MVQRIFKLFVLCFLKIPKQTFVQLFRGQRRFQIQEKFYLIAAFTFRKIFRIKLLADRIRGPLTPKWVNSISPNPSYQSFSHTASGSPHFLRKGPSVPCTSFPGSPKAPMPVSSPSPYALSLPRNDTRPPWIRCWHRNSLQYRQCSHPPRFSYGLHIPRHRKQDCHPFPSLGSLSPRYADEHPPDICEVLSGGGDHVRRMIGYRKYPVSPLRFQRAACLLQQIAYPCIIKAVKSTVQKLFIGTNILK